MSNALSHRWLVVAAAATMLLVLAAGCSAETVEVPGETVVVEVIDRQVVIATPSPAESHFYMGPPLAQMPGVGG